MHPERLTYTVENTLFLKIKSDKIFYVEKYHSSIRSFHSMVMDGVTNICLSDTVFVA